MANFKKQGMQSIALADPPYITAWASMVGPKEGEGPWKDFFDWILDDYLFGENTWEKGESKMLRETVKLAMNKLPYNSEEVELLIAGDLLNQLLSANFAARDLDIPFLGVYGACSTMALSLLLAAMLIDGGFFEKAAAGASSHHYAAERQYRFPVEQGVQKAPSSQWTVTGAGSVILEKNVAGAARVTGGTIGRIVDLQQSDVSDMGSAMAPAAASTIKQHFADFMRPTDYYDLVVTGDLGKVGFALAQQLFIRDGLMPLPNYSDCGVLIYEDSQEVLSGGSGCGCSAAMLCGPLLRKISDGEITRMLLVATGALMSPTSSYQGETIPCIAHAVAIEK